MALAPAGSRPARGRLSVTAGSVSTGYQRVFAALSIGWMALIFFLSHQPSLPTPSLFPGQDKLFHAVTFGILGGFYLGSWKQPETGYRWMQVFMVTGAVMLYGISDEVHQRFVPGRTMEFSDVLADTAGGLLAAAAIAALSRRRARQSATG